MTWGLIGNVWWQQSGRVDPSLTHTDAHKTCFFHLSALMPLLHLTLKPMNPEWIWEMDSKGQEGTTTKLNKDGSWWHRHGHQGDERSEPLCHLLLWLRIEDESYLHRQTAQPIMELPLRTCINRRTTNQRAIAFKQKKTKLWDCYKFLQIKTYLYIM